MPPRCHYDVLGVDLDADAAVIKKAHRRLALQYHPDKNPHESAAHEFRLVQQAYECLSDPLERKWYDEHRDAILKGWSSNGNNDNHDGDFCFDVMPYMYAGCYDGYGDGSNSFFSIYSTVFAKISESEGDDSNLPIDFGKADTDWKHVFAFYQAWESFATTQSFAWADLENVNDVPNRRYRRAVQDENRKRRKAAKKEYNDSILALVHFVKRRDIRYKAHMESVAAEKQDKAKLAQQQAAERKAQAQQLREQWQQDKDRAMAEAAERDRQAGRIRLADLEDDYDYGSSKKGKKKKGKNKNNKKQEEEKVDEAGPNGDEESDAKDDDDISHVKSDVFKNADDNDGDNSNKYGNDDDDVNKALDNDDDDNLVKSENMTPPDEEPVNVDSDNSSDDESSEPDVWRCECCRKDFKSEAQMENHFKSKKHKDALKKYEKRIVAELEQQLMEQMLDEDSDGE